MQASSTLKWVAPLIRRGFVSEGCKVNGAGGVEGLLWRAGRRSGEQDGVLITVAGGGVDREPEGVGGAAVTEPEQRDLLAVPEHAGDVGEAAVVPGPDLGQLRPVLLSVIQQPHDDRAAGRFRDGGHVPHHRARVAGPVRISCAGADYHSCDLTRSCYAAAWRGAGLAERRRAH